jgi:hypothetical protein
MMDLLKFEGANGAKNAYWSREMYRELFQFFSRRKNDNPRPLKAKDEASKLASLRSLRDQFRKLRSKETGNAFNESHILKHLSGLHYRPKSRQRRVVYYDRADLLKQGPLVIDFNQYTHGILTVDERERWLQGRDPFDNNDSEVSEAETLSDSSDESMDLGESDGNAIKPTHENSLDLSQSAEFQPTHILRQSDRDTTSSETQHRVRRRQDDGDRDYVPNTEDLSEDEDGNKRHKGRRLEPSMNEHPQQVKPISQVNGATPGPGHHPVAQSPSDQGHVTDITTDNSHDNADSPVAYASRSVTPRTLREAFKTISQKPPAQDFVGFGGLRLAPDYQAIYSKMKDIFTQIELAVTMRIENCRLSSDSLLTPDLLRRCFAFTDQELGGLACTIAGSGEVRRSLQMILNSDPGGAPPTLVEFTRSLLGCAVTTWALEPAGLKSVSSSVIEQARGVLWRRELCPITSYQRLVWRQIKLLVLSR